MSCVICNVKCEPWLLLKNKNIYVDENGKSIGDTIQTCGYSCSRKLDSKLPSNYGNLILNREDFCFWCVPIIPKKESFNILTFEEIQNLDEKNKLEYYNQRNKYLSNDYLISELYEELENEERMTYNIENICSESSENEYDDY